MKNFKKIIIFLLIFILNNKTQAGWLDILCCCTSAQEEKTKKNKKTTKTSRRNTTSTTTNFVNSSHTTQKKDEKPHFKKNYSEATTPQNKRFQSYAQPEISNTPQKTCFTHHIKQQETQNNTDYNRPSATPVLVTSTSNDNTIQQPPEFKLCPDQDSNDPKYYSERQLHAANYEDSLYEDHHNTVLSYSPANTNILIDDQHLHGYQNRINQNLTSKNIQFDAFSSTELKDYLNKHDIVESETNTPKNKAWKAQSSESPLDDND